jgi:hypothetical protein
MAAAKAIGGQAALPLAACAKPPSSSGYMRMGKTGSVAAAKIMASSATAKASE